MHDFSPKILASLLAFVCLLLWSRQGSAEVADCGRQFPWIEPALRQFAQQAFKSARASRQTTEEGLAALKTIRWGQHPPGMEEIILRPNETTGAVDMTVERVSNPNQLYKPVGLIKVLRRAVEAHQAELAALLKGRGEMRFIVETEDFPMTWALQNWKIPAFSMCADEQHIDIPVPDFTFEDYPETRYSNTSYWAIRDLVLMKGDMVPWGRRRRNLFMRHFGGVGYRKTLLPLLMGHQDNGTDNHHLGVKADVKDTGFVTSNDDVFIWLDQWCSYRYLLHTAGFAYSAGLKYKMACGSVIFMFESQFKEFYYPALQPGHHYVSLAEGDHDALHKTVFPSIKKEVRSMEDQYHDEPPPMAVAARKFVLEQLTQEALSCYWLKALTLYSQIYFSKTKDEVPKEIKFDVL